MCIRDRSLDSAIATVTPVLGQAAAGLSSNCVRLFISSVRTLGAVSRIGTGTDGDTKIVAFLRESDCA